jgi:hypothetical protein
MRINHDFVIIKTNEEYFAAFKDRWYRDYVIEFALTYKSHDAAVQAVQSDEVYPNMPCKHRGK